jgi:hypothetical protein
LSAGGRARPSWGRTVPRVSPHITGLLQHLGARACGKWPYPKMGLPCVPVQKIWAKDLGHGWDGCGNGRWESLSWVNSAARRDRADELGESREGQQCSRRGPSLSKQQEKGDEGFHADPSRSPTSLLCPLTGLGQGCWNPHR